MRNLYTILIITLSVIINFSSCTTNEVRDDRYGGTFKINASDVPDIVFPGRVLKQSEQLIVNQVYTGLVKYNTRSIEIVPSLATKWRAERNQTLYTFYLHNDAYFHRDRCFENKGIRQITAYDVKYSMEQIAKFHVRNHHEISSQLLNIEGSDGIVDSLSDIESLNISGIKVVNDTVIVFELKESDPLFLHYLASTNSLVFAHEAFETYGFESTVGSGAYIFSYPSIKGQAMSLLANPDYFQHNRHQYQLPFVDTIIVSFITSPPKELVLFENDELDMIIGISGDYVIDFLDRHIDQFQSNPPYYIMKQVTDSQKNLNYNFIRSNVQNMHINSIGYFDFSEIYFKDPAVQEIVIN